MDSFYILCNAIKLSQCLFLCVVHSVVAHMHVLQQTKEWKLSMLHDLSCLFCSTSSSETVTFVAITEYFLNNNIICTIIVFVS